MDTSMLPSLSFGIKQYWNGLCEIQPQGFYWVNTDSKSTARQLYEQLVTAQQLDIIPTVILAGDTSEHLEHLIERKTFLDERCCYYRLPDHVAALRALPEDLNRIKNKAAKLVILVLNTKSCLNLNEKQFHQWLTELSDYCSSKKCALVTICYGADNSRLKILLNSEHRALYGLSAMNNAVEPAIYSISWWHNQNGVEANSAYSLHTEDSGWRVISLAKEITGINAPQVQGDDQWMYLAERSVLEGAPALSDSWTLFDNNDALVERAIHARSATLVFTITNNNQVEDLARQIHLLRTQRGNGLKIVVREMRAAMRFIDERLFQTCGANLIVPHAARLSSFLTLLEDLRHLNYTRHVPENIDDLIKARVPTHHKGFLPLPDFCTVMQSIWLQAALVNESHGVLLALRPVAGISPQQAMSLCRLRRDGDITTVTEHHLYLFLSNCQTNDVNNVLKFIFSLSPEEIFTSRTIWYQDQDIQNTVRDIALLKAPVIKAAEKPPMQPKKSSDATPIRTPAAISIHFYDNDQQLHA